MQRFWCFIVFCTLSCEFEMFWGKKWSTPMHYLGDVLFGPVPGLRVPWYDIIVVVLLVLSAKPGKRSAKPISTALATTLAAFAAWSVYGALRAGSVLDMRLQLHTGAMVLITAIMQMRLFKTRQHYVMLAKVIVYAALLRAVLILIFYITVWRHLDVFVPSATHHWDTLLFVTTIVIMLAIALHDPTRGNIVRTLLVTGVMLWCIQMNGRRLAYVSLVGAMGVMLALMWKSQLRKKLTRYGLYAAPVLGLYFAIGWSHPTGIFKPLASLQSVGDVNDPSTQSRILEDIGLIVTLQGNPIIGPGFGQKYHEISTTYSVSGYFPQYRYVPHNSVLGLLAFTGMVGFSLIWMVFPVTAYLAARSYVFATLPLDKAVAMVALCEVMIHIVQLWGDIGINALPSLVLMSAAISAAAHFSVFTGAWPGLPGPATARGTG